MQTINKILSVIVPSYNMEAYLPQCLGSLIVDDVELLNGLEVVVVNDGSQDRTSAIAHDFAGKYPGVFKVIDKENGNYGSCINAGLKMASGSFVKILDADDSYDTNEFSRFMMALACSEKANEDIDLYVTDYVEVDATGCKISKRTFPLPVGLPKDIDSIEKLPLLYMHAVTYRTKNLLDIGYIQTEGISYTDNEWVCYPLMNVNKFRYENISVYKYLVGRSGQTMDPRQYNKALIPFSKIAMRMSKEFCKMDSHVPDVVKRYIAEFVTMINSRVYDISIIGVHTKESDLYLDNFDRRLAVISSSFHVAALERLISKRTRFHYGWYWYHYRSSATLKMRLFRLYRMLAAKFIAVHSALGLKSK